MGTGVARKACVWEVVARVVDPGAHGVAGELVQRVGYDLLDVRPRCVRVQPGVEVFGRDDHGHAVMDMNDARRCRLGEQGAGKHQSAVLSCPDGPK